MACGCLQTQSPPLPNSVAGTLGNARGHDPCATPSFPGIPDRQNHSATESIPDTPCSLPRLKTTPETPQTSEERGFSMSPSHQRHYPWGSLESISHPDCGNAAANLSSDGGSGRLPPVWPASVLTAAAAIRHLGHIPCGAFAGMAAPQFGQTRCSAVLFIPAYR